MRGATKQVQPPTLEEILAELEQAAVAQEAGAMTSREWMAHWNVSREKALNLIRSAIQQGRMTAHNVLRDSIMRPGYRERTTVYKFVGKRGAA